MKRNGKTDSLAFAGLTAAAYVVLTMISASMGLSSGVIQIRLSEALCILPCFNFGAVPGLAAGCLLANLLTGALPWDVLFGTIATLLGALGTWFLGRKGKSGIAWIPPVLSNALIIPPVLTYVYGVETAYPLIVLTVAAGEVISCGILGLFLRKAVTRLEIK